ncbi:MAG TPA: MmgE/PrpD family protein [Burkholderiales bacterium]|nr:MmgE/PrpD family protein [Burkholderiales bacterium]
MTTLTHQLATKILDIRFDALPAAAIDIARQVTLDGLAVMLAGSTEPLGVGRISIEYVKAMGGAPHASVIAGGFKTSMPNAAYANGTMAHALDFDNTWYPLNHPTSPTLPAILAIAEHEGLSGRRVIEAIVAAFEVQGRLRLAATGMETGSGFHKPGMTGTFGAVAGAGHALGLNHRQMLMALGLAGSRAGSIALNTGTMTKSSHSGHAARTGVECALLARMGWTATADVFGPKGFFDTFYQGVGEPHRLIEGFASPLRMVDPGVGFKKHPSNYFTHRPIDAALALRAEHGIDASQIEHVEVIFPRFEYVNRPFPETGLDGKFSVQYTAAIALLDGEITVDSFNNARRFAPDVEALLKRVTLTTDDAIPKDFDRMYAIVKVTMKNGSQYSNKVERLSGWVGNPLTREQRLTKFHSCARRVLNPEDATRVVELVERLDTLATVNEIMDRVRTPTRTSL